MKIKLGEYSKDLAHIIRCGILAYKRDYYLSIEMRPILGVTSRKTFKDKIGTKIRLYEVFLIIK